MFPFFPDKSIVKVYDFQVGKKTKNGFILASIRFGKDGMKNWLEDDSGSGDARQKSYIR